MRTTILFAASIVLSSAQAINMREYDPACGVDPQFGTWYSELLGNFEDPTSTSGATDFFASNGSLISGGVVATGAEAILEARAFILPSDGSVEWNHFPNVTVVASESATYKTFLVNGVLQIVSTADSSCSTTFYQTLFTVEKNITTGKANLALQGGGLLIYDAFSVNSSDAPCNK